MKYQKVLSIIALIVILIFSFLSRMQYVSERNFVSDERLYTLYEEKLSKNLNYLFSKEINNFHPPLFPALLMLGKMIFSAPSSLESHILTVTFISLLGLIAIYCLGCKISGIFLGLFAALCLALNLTYFSYSVFVLNDVPSAVCFILFLLSLSYVEPMKNYSSDLTVAVIAFIATSMKWSNIIVLPMIICFYFFMPRTMGLSRNMKKMSAALGAYILFLLPLLINNMRNMGTIFPDMRSFAPSDYSVLKLFQIYLKFSFPSYTIYLFGLCVLVIFIQRKFWPKFLLLFIALGFLGLTTLKIHDSRYGIFLLPPYILSIGWILSLLIHRLSHKKILQITVIFIILLGLVNNYQFLIKAADPYIKIKIALNEHHAVRR